MQNFQLGTLSAYFGHRVLDMDRHRALGDATATMIVFQNLIERLAQYDAGTLRQVGQFARAGQWKDAWFFEEFARTRLDGPLFDPSR